MWKEIKGLFGLVLPVILLGLNFVYPYSNFVIFGNYFVKAYLIILGFSMWIITLLGPWYYKEHGGKRFFKNVTEDSAKLKNSNIAKIVFFNIVSIVLAINFGFFITAFFALGNIFAVGFILKYKDDYNDTIDKKKAEKITENWLADGRNN
jgi:hypothetical protein